MYLVFNENETAYIFWWFFYKITIWANLFHPVACLHYWFPRRPSFAAERIPYLNDGQFWWMARNFNVKGFAKESKISSNVGLQLLAFHPGKLWGWLNFWYFVLFTVGIFLFYLFKHLHQCWNTLIYFVDFVFLTSFVVILFNVISSSVIREWFQDLWLCYKVSWEDGRSKIFSAWTQLGIFYQRQRLHNIVKL